MFYAIRASFVVGWCYRPCLDALKRFIKLSPRDNSIIKRTGFKVGGHLSIFTGMFNF